MDLKGKRREWVASPYKKEDEEDKKDERVEMVLVMVNGSKVL